ncbi:DNA-binding response regulator, OmpR family, contains REC and winged-helix (wHTH) domain [Acetitomaculum ruminis DSM 5522]|uniref:Stage 0 sporulation protein A homolog n=1 Tax=Acetitomaculum ruminis DSM 5522 TaxID=1120918 RepID=A0A1I0W4U4_9FIRM|nr:DNA-binding response regulator, OmpR family, contains REC and winged-helix (wHTH) domain [Acetitomaculum ruminis DSM 5522]
MEYLRFISYDVVFMDIMKPVMDGISAVKTLRQNNNLTPVIFLSAKGETSDRVNGLNVGANDYLVKLFSFDELIARIKSVIRTANSACSEIYTVSDLELDCCSHIVKRAGQEINLAKKEYQLLEFLVRNTNRIISRDTILSQVWGYNYEGGDNVVDVYINYLRKKIDIKKYKPLIHTVRGLGYTIKNS